MENIKLDWKEYYADTLTATVNKKMSLKKIRDITQKISDTMHAKGKDGFIGVAVHFKDQNTWTPSVSSKFGEKVHIFAEDSTFDSGGPELYEDDKPNKFQLFVHIDEKKQYLKPNQLDKLLEKKPKKVNKK